MLGHGLTSASHSTGMQPGLFESRDPYARTSVSQRGSLTAISAPCYGPDGRQLLGKCHQMGVASAEVNHLSQGSTHGKHHDNEVPRQLDQDHDRYGDTARPAKG